MAFNVVSVTGSICVLPLVLLSSLTVSVFKLSMVIKHSKFITDPSLLSKVLLLNLLIVSNQLRHSEFTY